MPMLLLFDGSGKSSAGLPSPESLAAGLRFCSSKPATCIVSALVCSPPLVFPPLPAVRDDELPASRR